MKLYKPESGSVVSSGSGIIHVISFYFQMTNMHNSSKLLYKDLRVFYIHIHHLNCYYTKLYPLHGPTKVCVSCNAQIYKIG